MYPITTGSILAWLYPAATANIDYTVNAVGDGAEIGFWAESLGPQPTVDEVAAQELPWVMSVAHAARTAERIRKQTSGFPCDGHIYRSDREESIPLLTAAAIGAQIAMAQGVEAVAAYDAGLGDGWRDITGEARITTALGILGLHMAFTSWGAACDRAAQAIKADIDAAESVAQVEDIIAAIPTDTRWP